MKKIGILGAYGNVGRNALRYLYDTGNYKIYAFGRNLSKVENDSFFKDMRDVEWTCGDVTNNNQLEEFIADKDIILNTVSCSSIYSIKIAETCLKNGKRYVDAGMIQDFGNIKDDNRTKTLIYGAGALPGLSSVIGVYAVEGFKTVTKYTHITSMEGEFSYGSAFDYLKGVSEDMAKGDSRGFERISNFNIPFVGFADIRRYSDNETNFITNITGCSDSRYYISFGSGKLKGITENAVIGFQKDPENSVKQLIEFSRIYNIKAKEHIAFVIEVKGIIDDDKEKVKTTVLKFSSSPVLTGMSAGLCTEIVALSQEEMGVFSFTELPSTPFYKKFLPHILSALQNSKDTYIFETYSSDIEELNEESFGEI